MSKEEKERKKLVKKVFSREAFNSLLVDYLNDPEFESHVMKVSGDEAVKVKTYPVKKFRKILRNILIDFGVDKNDAEAIMTTYKFRKKDVEEMYDFISDFIYQYLSTGRRLKLFEREDAVASIIFEDMDTVTKTYTIGKDKKKYNRKEKSHKKAKIKSPCPDWQKEELDETGEKVLKAMKIACKDL